jgi:hypothetical protein
MTKRPIVSICIPVWNRPEMLRDALESAMAQTYEPLEITVVDNASTDETAEVARELARGDERIHVYVNDHNVGGRNYIMTLNRSRGELVKFLNSDDLLEPTCVTRLVEAMEQPDVALAFCPSKYIDGSGSVMPAPARYRLLGVKGSAVLDGLDLGNRILASNANLIGAPTQVLWRRAALYGGPMGLEERPRHTIGDVGLWLALLSRGNAAYVDEELTVQRLHKGQHQAMTDFRVFHAFDWLEIAQTAASRGFLRDRTSKTTATTVALRQLAWRLDPSSPHARPLLEGVRMACERLRVQHGGGTGVGSHLGLISFLFVASSDSDDGRGGDGSDAERITRAWLEAFGDRVDVRLLIAADSATLPAVQARLRPLRDDPTSPLALNLVEEIATSGDILVRGPLLHVAPDATAADFLASIPHSRLGVVQGYPWQLPRDLLPPEGARLRIVRQLAAEFGLAPGPGVDDAFVDCLT